MSALSRRATLAVPAAIVAAPALPASAAQPDAEVIRLAAEVVRCEAAYVASYCPEARTAEEEAARAPEQGRLAALPGAATDALALVAPRPRFIGSPGWVRSSAWVWLFSSTDSTSACLGGLPLIFLPPSKPGGSMRRPLFPGS